MSKEIKKDLNGLSDNQIGKMYPVLETAIPINNQPPSSNGVPQAAVRYINHSRNPSSVSKNAVTFATLPPNKPNAIDSVLKIIGLRSNHEKSQQKKICFVRITSTEYSQYIFLLFHHFSHHFRRPVHQCGGACECNESIRIYIFCFCLFALCALCALVGSEIKIEFYR